MIDETKARILSSVRTIAVVGLSSNPGRAGYYVPAYLQAQGYQIIPVNPNLQEALGERAYASLTAVPQPIDLVLIFQRSEKVPPLVDEAIAVAATAVWLQTGIYHEAAAAKARQAGLDVVMDACMMVEHRRWHAQQSPEI
ncbi:MAG: CoA-binding protein [Ardenticatenaceae bacterium]|nr:CoA-binding protein [Ardenticatenaceae bacterium]